MEEDVFAPELPFPGGDGGDGGNGGGSDGDDDDVQPFPAGNLEEEGDPDMLAPAELPFPSGDGSDGLDEDDVQDITHEAPETTSGDGQARNPALSVVWESGEREQPTDQLPTLSPAPGRGAAVG